MNEFPLLKYAIERWECGSIPGAFFCPDSISVLRKAGKYRSPIFMNADIPLLNFSFGKLPKILSRKCKRSEHGLDLPLFFLCKIKGKCTFLTSLTPL